MPEILTTRQSEIWSLRHEKKLTFQKISDKIGIGISAVHSALKRAERKLGPDWDKLPALPGPEARLAALAEELERCVADPSDATVIRLAQDLRVRALLMADNSVLAQASGPGLMQVVNGATNMIQLLKGAPTAITRYEDMSKLDDFLMVVSAELRRRGDGVDVIDVTPDKEAE